MRINYEALAMLIAIIVILIVLVWRIYSWIRCIYLKAPQNIASEAKKCLIFYFLAISIIESLNYYLGRVLDYEGILIDIYFILSYNIKYILHTFLAVVIFWSIFYSKIKEINKADQSKYIEDIVCETLDSKEFATALRTSLPRGENDNKNGLDFIPFLLHRLDEKRISYQKSTNRFLISLISMGLVFIFTISFFGYIIINTSSSGVYKYTSILSNEIDAISINIHNSNKSLLNYLQNEGIKTENIPIDLKDGELLKARSKIDELIGLGYAINLKYYLYELPEKKFNKTSNQKIEDNLTMSKVIKKIDIYLDSLVYNKAEIENALELAQKASEEIIEEIHKPEFLRDDLIKRLSISLIVATFFIAILRYLSNLYRSHYAELIKTEEQDMFIRKFYVAYKGSSDDNSSKDKIVEAFLSKDHDLHGNNSSRLGSEEVGIIGELLKSIGRKI
ncbi:hypothetical protein VIBNISFn27_940087 [Vibrio nigripulchritudo SFn27]|uniref:Uncharacterized protein n=2 Tax=Vibrio nigripulchritudo TaxID=28173 RepID=U4KI89_9VIBR|nr:hypothetical protein [Vibrio nigripulchritudo]CCN82436.1 hypothetical protein VIBNIBLFn1_470088 [Vibrio nigripulchritudo BLFn1]CCN91422.1 hypothetical protein VIBNISFn27_940087 [Vibrio nigripulchritudo SFn27]CCN97587.1 hypothetical protein VIBNIENn2_990088 [Vibrio nigripulchritudo ENn2]CCO38729.1 hypothetical protein VIBNISFn135_1060087 [Vibrio nigripulchritudo SFn135]CCO55134.1 hypothetical protein VIBNIWn13_780088 [Vibrio nigripulchritudo Wn13]